jgi:hypothetical protein
MAAVGGGGGVDLTKTTVYRRNATPLALVLAAIGRLNAEIPDVDTGDARADLVTAVAPGRIGRSGPSRRSGRG